MRTSINLADRHDALLKMGKDFHNFCITNDIKYSLAYGTLLGAIRHNGFIPWDDDLDIIMDRTNYEKFLKISFNLEGYKTFPYLWIYRIKKQGDISRTLDTPTIDIFVFDKIPKNPLIRFFKTNLLRVLQGMMHTTVSKQKFPQFALLFICFLLGKTMPYKNKLKLYDKCMKLGNNSSSDLYAIFNGPYNSLTISFNNIDYTDISLHVFEDTEFYVLNAYDEILTNLYGDYMTPPPDAQRVPKH